MIEILCWLGIIGLLIVMGILAYLTLAEPSMPWEPELTSEEIPVELEQRK